MVAVILAILLMLDLYALLIAASDERQSFMDEEV